MSLAIGWWRGACFGLGRAGSGSWSWANYSFGGCFGRDWRVWLSGRGRFWLVIGAVGEVSGDWLARAFFVGTVGVGGFHGAFGYIAWWCGNGERVFLCVLGRGG